MKMMDKTNTIRKMKRLRFLLIMTILTAFGTLEAQEVSPVDFMRMNPYQINSNPAADLPYQSVMALLVGDVNVNCMTSTFRFDNLFDFDLLGRPKTWNLNKFASSLATDNYLGFTLNENLFAWSQRLKEGMLTVGYNVRVQSDFSYNDGLFKLLAYGNAAFVGEDNPVTISLNLNAQMFQEFAVGYQYNITEKLSVGGRAKLLFGFANINTDALEAQLFTDPESYALRVKEHVAMRASLPNLFVANEGNLETRGSFRAADLFRNPGFGVDMGAEYRFNEHFSAVAAVNDLGFIYWSGNNVQLKGDVKDAGHFYDEDSFLYEGLDFDQMQQVFSDAAYQGAFLDSLKQYFQWEFTPTDSYNTMLNTGVLLRGNYDIDGHNRFSLQGNGRFTGNGFRPSMTVAYSGSFFNMLDVCTTYTIKKHSYDNIGLGLAGNFGIFHIYVASSNVIGLFKPLNASAMDVQMGIVFNLRKY